MIELEELKRFIEGEKAKNSHLENELMRAVSKVQHLEELLRGEKERFAQKERAIDELTRQREVMASEHEEHICQRKAEYEALKRGFDELHYESENLRRTVNTKQEEIAGLNKIVNQQSHSND